MIIINPLLLVDSYKLSHVHMLDAVTDGGLEYLYSNFTNRGSRVPGVNHVVFYGFQMFLTEIEERFKHFFEAPLSEVLDDYKSKTSTFVAPGFDFSHIESLHKLGYLPLKFRAVSEGTLVPMRVPSLTVENTVSGFGWLVNYVETWISSSIWHPSTNATTAWNFRRVLDKFAADTSDTPEAVDFQLHDFSFRGMSNWESAATSGSAHLISFRGSDVVPVIDFVDTYYPGEENGLIGASVAATEHSIMCSGTKELELQTYDRLLDLYPEGIVSIVSDTWSLWDVIGSGGILSKLKNKILARDGKLVIRPDSGNPIDIICGTVPATGLLPTGSPEQKGSIELLWDLFGGTVNSKGYRVLDPHIGLIYGDSITLDSAKTILARLKAKGFDSTNVVFGGGSYLYNGMVTRDTFGSAIKATQAIIHGVPVDIQKDPITDNGLKKSATGRLAVLNKADGSLYLVEKASQDQEDASLLKTVWEDGKFVRTQSYANVRETLKLSTDILARNGSIA